MTYVVPYLYPTSARRVTDSFADHVKRGSVNPGTDYAAAYGSRVVAVADGYVAGVELRGYGSGGLMVYVDHDDGLGTDYLHLSQVAAGIVNGKRVFRGDLLGLSGGSGFGDPNYYDAHLHISIRNAHGWHTYDHGNFDFDWFIKNQAGVSGDGSTPVPVVLPPVIPRRKLDMKVIKVVQPTGTTYALVGTRFFQSTTDVAQANAWAEVWGDAGTVSDRAWAEAYNAARL